VSVRIHRGITRQHPRLHQHPHHKNSTPNISTRCWGTLHEPKQNAGKIESRTNDGI